MNTTLRTIAESNPNKLMMQQLMSYMGKTEVDDTAVSMELLLECFTLADALWFLRTFPSSVETPVRRFAVEAMSHVKDLLTHPASLKAVDMARRFSQGNAYKEELESAWDRAYSVSLRDTSQEAELYAADAAADACYPLIREGIHSLYSNLRLALGFQGANAVTQADTKLRSRLAELV